MFTHLHVHSNFSFLDAGSSVEGLVDRAKELGYKALAITDHNGLYGAVRFYKYAKENGIKPILGVEMTVDGGYHIVLLAKNLNGYSNLCRIITRAHLSHEKGEASASFDVLRQYKDDLFCLSGCRNGEIASNLLEGKQEAALDAAMKYMEIFGKENFLIELQNHLLPGTSLLNSQLVEIAEQLGLKTVASNNVHYARKGEFKVQDILVCVQTITTLDDEHELRRKNCEYYLKSPKAMANLFKRYPEAVKTAGWVADRCDVDLSLGTYRFPDFPVPDGETAYSYLCKLCFEGLERLYKPITPQATERLQYELKVIHDLGFAEYFLAVWDIVRYAWEQKVRCSGRGSAADSMVAYCLGITIVDPLEHDLLFERFLNPGRRKMPDIDIDFDAQKRDDVIAYIYKRFGEDKVAMVCTVSTLCARSSIRDIGKAMDFPPDDINRLAKALPHTGGKRIREAIEKLPELRDSNIPLWKLETLVDVCEKIDGFPRHLSVHLGGVVISRGLLTDLVPLEWATKGVVVSQFDKDDIETLGLVKMDILGLRNLSAIEDALALIKENRGIDLDIDNIPLDDPRSYQLLRSTRTVGLFQLESPGMRGLLGRLQPAVFDDVTANVALFRPGPMQADMINPFIARRHGQEPVTYLHPCLEPILKETYGVILYQEQVLRISNALAGFDMAQADSFRRAMTTDRSQDEMEKIREEFIDGCLKRGVKKDIAEAVFSKLRAFAAYGFCKAHAASFGKIAYQTAYLKAHYPAEFMAGILSNEPMGFYPPNVIAEEARHFGIRILPVDVNRSAKSFTVEYFTAEDAEGAEGRVISDQSSVISKADDRPGHAVLVGCSPDMLSADTAPDQDKMSREPGSGTTCPGPSTDLPDPRPLTPDPYRRSAIRISLSQVRGMTEAAIRSITSARAEKPFESFSDFCLRTKMDRPIIENLINCGAFDSFGHPRGKLMWLLGEVIVKGPGVRGPGQGEVYSEPAATAGNSPRPPTPPPPPPRDGCLFDGLSATDLDEQLKYLPDVPDLTPHERLRMDYEILGLSSMGHPMIFYREKLSKIGVIKSSEIRKKPDNALVRAAGVMVVCMRPPTKSGAIIVFVTLEDEDGLVDAVVFPKVYDKYGKIIYNNPALILEGRVKRLGKRSVSIVVSKVSELGVKYRSDQAADSTPFKERIRSAGHRSWVKSQGV